MNTKNRWTTTLKLLDPSRRELFGKIFPDAIMPVKSIIPIKADLPDRPNVHVYLLDIDAITDAQRTALIFALAQRFGATMADVEYDMDTRGVPILAENVSVISTDVWDLRQFT